MNEKEIDELVKKENEAKAIIENELSTKQQRSDAWAVLGDIKKLPVLEFGKNQEKNLENL